MRLITVAAYLVFSNDVPGPEGKAISPGLIEDKIGGSPKSGATKMDHLLN